MLSEIFLDGFAEEQKISFDYEVPNAETLAAMKEAESGKLESYDSVNQIFSRKGNSDSALFTDLSVQGW